MRYFAFAALAALSASSIAVSYVLDDGVAENNIGLTNGGVLLCANQFTAAAGGEKITTVSIAFGPATDGAAVTVNLWSDPNNDGLPTDSTLLSSVAGVIANNNTDTFNVFDIPDVVLTAGQNFFVGFTTTHAAAQFPGRVDQTPVPLGKSWVNVGTDITSSITLQSLAANGLDGDWLIRATGEALVPEPATMAVLGLGAAALIRRRRKA